MAVDPSLLTEAAPSAETTAPLSVSEPKPKGAWSGLLERILPSRAPEATATEPTGEREPVSTPAPEHAPATSQTPPPTAEEWKPPSSREEYETAISRAAQAETDRRESKRRQDAEQQAETERQQRLVSLRSQWREARREYGDESLEAARLAAQVDDVEQGLERDWNDAQTQQQLFDTLSLQAARRTHTAAFSPLLDGLPDAETEEIGHWFKTQTTPDAQGRVPLAADEALSKLAQRITKARDAHIRAQVLDELADSIRTDPETRQMVIAQLYGAEDFGEPEHLVGGSLAGLPTDEELDRMTPQQYLARKFSPDAEKRLLTRPRR